MADITVTTDVSQINNLKDALKSLDPVFVKIVDGIVRENSRLQRLLKKAAKDTEENNKILAQAQEAYSAKVEQESAKREKARAREAAAAEKEAKRIAAAVEKKAAAEARAAQVQAGNRADTAFALGKQRYEEEARALEELNRAKQAAASREDVLRQKYDESYRAMVIYRTQIQELNEALSVGVLTQAGYKDRIDQLNQSLADGSIVAGAYTNQASDGMNKFGVAAQQTGYQVSDFIVQVQSGTNPLVAFSQQATQLAGLLYLLPASMQAARIGIGAFSVSMATATAGVTILIPLLAMIAMNFIGSGKESEEASKKVDKQTKAYEGLIAKIEELRLKRQMEASGIQGQDEQVTINEINRLLEQRAEIQSRLSQLQNAGGRAAGYAQAKQDQMELLQLELDKNQAAIDALENERKIEIAVRRRANDLRDQYREQKNINTAAEDAIVKYSMMRTVAAGIANEMARAAANTQAAANAALTAMRMEFSPAGGAMAQYGGRGTTSDRPITNQYGDVITLPGSNRPKGRPTDIDFGLSDLGRAGGGKTVEDTLAKLREQLALENELLGVSEAQKRVMQALGDQRSKYSEAEINSITAEVEAYNLKLEALKQQEQLAKTMQSSMETAFMSIVSGTESAKDAFKKMAYEVVKELYKVLVVQRMVGQFQSGGGGILGGLAGLFGARASGGSVMPGKSYLVGENGPELVIPRHSGTVVNANQTASAGGGNGGFTQNLTISVTGSDSAMVRAEVAKMIPQITNATKAAVIDARLRGGQMKAAFS